jgi:LPXTG-motif cell wall-anchored protein
MSRQASTASRRRTRSAITALSVTSAATLGTLAIAAPALAAGSSGSSPSGQQISPQLVQAYLAKHPELAQQQRFKAMSTGVGEQAFGDFGLGKLPISITPKDGTYPPSLTPDFGMVAVTVDDTTADVTQTCTVDGGPFGCVVPIGDDFTLTVDQSTMPDGFLAPAPYTFTLDPASCAYPPFSGFPASCAGVTLVSPGTWRPVGLHVVNAVTGAPVVGATYELCSATPSEPALTALACPAGSTALDSETTGSSGGVTFTGLYQGSPNFSTVQTAIPSGYVADTVAQPLDVPAVTTLAEAGTAYVGTIKVQPKPPVTQNDTASLPENTSKSIAVLANDTAVTAPLTLTSVTKPAHGTAAISPDGTVSYQPATGFVGTDSFTYTARNALGGTSTSTVTVTVTDVPPTATPVHLTTTSGTPVTFDAFSTVTAAAGSTLSKLDISKPAHGTAVDPAGSITYTPATGFAGTDTFSYRVSDGNGGVVTVPVTVDVTAPAVKGEAAARLPMTGAASSTEAGAGAGLLGLGFLLVLAGRRRRREA